LGGKQAAVGADGKPYPPGTVPGEDSAGPVAGTPAGPVQRGQPASGPAGDVFSRLGEGFKAGNLVEMLPGGKDGAMAKAIEQLPGGTGLLCSLPLAELPQFAMKTSFCRCFATAKVPRQLPKGIS
jgi:hypothetical protein